MMHSKRTWAVKVCSLDEAAADMARCLTYVGCSGWQVDLDGQTWLLLNDSTSEDGAQELGVCLLLEPPDEDVRRALPVAATVRQVESLTVSWIETRTPEQIREAIAECIRNPVDYWKEQRLWLDWTAGHHCGLCA